MIKILFCCAFLKKKKKAYSCGTCLEIHTQAEMGTSQSLRPAWSTMQVPGQPGQHRETLYGKKWRGRNMWFWNLVYVRASVLTWFMVLERYTAGDFSTAARDPQNSGAIQTVASLWKQRACSLFRNIQPPWESTSYGTHPFSGSFKPGNSMFSVSGMLTGLFLLVRMAVRCRHEIAWQCVLAGYCGSVFVPTVLFRCSTGSCKIRFPREICSSPRP